MILGFVVLAMLMLLAVALGVGLLMLLDAAFNLPVKPTGRSPRAVNRSLDPFPQTEPMSDAGSDDSNRRPGEKEVDGSTVVVRPGDEIALTRNGTSRPTHLRT